MLQVGLILTPIQHDTESNLVLDKLQLGLLLTPIQPDIHSNLLPASTTTLNLAWY